VSIIVSFVAAAAVGLLLISDALTPSGASGGGGGGQERAASTPDPDCVGPEPCGPRETYQAEVAAICKAANERARAALDDRLVPGSSIEDPANLTAADLEILRVMNGIVLRRSVAVLAALRTLDPPAADRPLLEQDFALREREVAVLRSIVSAATAGNIPRVQRLHDRQIDLVGMRARDVPGHLPETCLISFGA
jgi:hypothetical protein